ncbi:L,D-transpeptidase family protein [Azorhizobium caulinodans]|uniref:L,D-transpeptidase family protein n=1 Tax=Azorhizobium caulinodans TaxID=7 RepID=UPI0002EA04FC|nr:L,D-transpeptidase family protein [Azorhizobium caulinodans]
MLRPLPWPSAGRVFAGLMLGAVFAGAGLPVLMPADPAVASTDDTSPASRAAAASEANGIAWPPAHVEPGHVSTPAAKQATPAAPVTPAPAATQAATPAPSAPAAPANAAATPAAPAVATPSTTAEAPKLNPLAEQVRQILAVPALEGLGITKREQEAIQSFYAARQDEPVFVTDKGLNAVGKGVEARFAAAAEDGLDPAAYPVPKLAAQPDLPALARAEVRLAASALLYARHAQAGRFDPSRISPQLTPLRTFPDPVTVLSGLVDAKDASAVLAAYNPTHAGYKALKAKLALADSHAGPAPVRVPGGPTLRPGDMDARVPALRARLGLKSATASDRLYDADLARAVAAFQGASGLNADGVVGPSTLEVLNRVENPAERRADIIANMERWRWLPRDLGSVHVMVNIPEFVVRVVDDGKTIHQTRVVVGKPENQTPLLTHDMEYVVLNPYWNIPPSIARKEMLPNLQRDPYFLARQGMEVVKNGRVVDPGTVNWAQGTGGYSFRQPPGERNALGRIKFMFPNDHSVYLHDTPSKALFANDRRAYSHGCIRVQDPLKFAEVIFNIGMPGQGWTDEKIGKMLGGAERYLTLKQRIPVHLVYFTTFVDDSGRLVSREDVYGTNAKVKEALGLDGEQKVAGRAVPVPR